jgi:hypothetical protein
MKHLILIFFCILILIGRNANASQDIFVIGNSASQITEMTLKELQDVFHLRKTFWGNGQKIKVFLLPNSSLIARRFLSEVLKISPSLYYDLINNSFSSGKSNIPTYIDRQETMIIKVMINSGGIGYTDIPQDEFNESRLNVIKVLP